MLNFVFLHVLLPTGYRFVNIVFFFFSFPFSSVRLNGGLIF